jgi:opacity protein-like surface antigen
MIRRSVLVLLVASTAAGALSAQPIAFAALYGGIVQNRTDLEGSTATDTGPMAGAYAQVIVPDRFQVNDFLYYAWDVNDSTVLGNHFIADFYPIQLGIGSTVIGGGFEFIRLDLDDGVTEYEQTVTIPYARVGQYFNVSGPVRVSLLPWTGVGYQTIRGEGTVTIDPPGPTPEFKEDFDVDDSGYLWMNGINLTVGLARYLDVQLKYGLYYDVEAAEPYNNVTGMVNVFASRHIGASLRLKYSESVDDNYTLYSMLGVVYAF